MIAHSSEMLNSRIIDRVAWRPCASIEYNPTCAIPALGADPDVDLAIPCFGVDYTRPAGPYRCLALGGQPLSSWLPCFGPSAVPPTIASPCKCRGFCPGLGLTDDARTCNVLDCWPSSAPAQASDRFPRSSFIRHDSKLQADGYSPLKPQKYPTTAVAPLLPQSLTGRRRFLPSHHQCRKMRHDHDRQKSQEHLR